MKNKIFLLLLVVILAFACKKTDTPVSTGGSPITTDPAKPVLNMNVNDTFWQGADPFADAIISVGNSDSTYTIHAGGSNSSKLNVAFLKIRYGKQSLNGKTTFTMSKITYTLDTGSVVISSYNAAKNIISGSFQFSAINSLVNKRVTITKGFFSNVNLYR